MVGRGGGGQERGGGVREALDRQGAGRGSRSRRRKGRG